MSNSVVVNLSTSAYEKGQIRLEESIKVMSPNVDCLMFKSEQEIGAPMHTENPYAFKIFAIRRAMRLGYWKILWLDSSVYAVKDITPIFERMTARGMFMEEAGHYVGSFCNDQTLRYFDITREEAMEMPMFSAGMIGFDFRSDRLIALQFLERWEFAMKNGCFKGSWVDHRHDMTCASIIANKMGLVKDYSPGGTYFAYIGDGYAPPAETALCHLQGLA